MLITKKNINRQKDNNNTQSSWIELKASGNPINELKKIETTSPILEEIIYLIKAFILA